MKFTDYIKNKDLKLDFFIKTLSNTNRTPDYYVNWNKVLKNKQEVELQLNTLNYLIGKEDIETEALRLFKQQPDLLKVVPSLIATREKQLNILTSVNNMEYYTLDFNKIDTNKIKDYVEFLSAVGLLHFIQNNVGRSLVDFVTGVEVGLESNARKNRSGTIMESILESYIKKIAINNNMEYSTQCTVKFIKDTWNIAVPTDKARRRFDAVLYSKEHHKIWIFETNYYGGGGSKLKSVSGEFTELQSLINTSDEDITFVWITDGKGWNTSKLPLQEAFGHIPYIFNLKMLSNGFLQDLITFDILKETRKVK